MGGENEHIRELESRLAERELELLTTREELQRVQSSLGWRALQRYRQLATWLVPSGTGRNRLYRRAREAALKIGGGPRDDVESLMRREWDERARENARYYIVTGDWESEEVFDRSGESAVEEILADIDEHLTPEAAVLEIGCGIGRMLKPLARRFRRVYGVDVSPQMIDQAKQRLKDVANVKVFANNGSDLAALRDGQLDAVFSFIVFQHIPAIEPIANYISEAYRVLKPGGIVKFQVHGRPDTAEAAAQELSSEKTTWRGVWFTELQIRRLTESKGFSIVSSYFRPTPGAPPHQYLWVIAKKPEPANS